MMKIARLDENGQVVEIMPHAQFSKEVLASCVNVPDNVGVGYYVKGGQIIDPPPGPGYILNPGNVWVEDPVVIRQRRARQAKQDFLNADLGPVNSIAALKAVIAHLQTMLGKE